MTVLETLRGQGIEIVPDGDGLRLRGPASKITDEVRGLVAVHKAEILAAFHRSAPVDLLTFEQLVEAIRYSRTHLELEEYLEQINAHERQQTLTATQVESLVRQMVYESRRIARGEINVPYTVEVTP